MRAVHTFMQNPLQIINTLKASYNKTLGGKFIRNAQVKWEYAARYGGNKWRSLAPPGMLCKIGFHGPAGQHC